MSSGPEHISSVFHKEKKQKKNKETNGQIDNLRGYHTPYQSVNRQMATDDKQIKRDANLYKNIHIDESLEKLRAAGLLNEGYDAFYCKVMHQIGVAKMSALAQISIDRVRPGNHPAQLFHFLINKELGK
jgi:hypothetical protein